MYALALMVCHLHTFLFADLAGFTDFTDRHGDERAAELAVSFHEQVASLAQEHGCEVVKTIGDAVMVRGENCPAAVRLAQQIIERALREGLPPVRVGLDTAPGHPPKNPGVRRKGFDRIFSGSRPHGSQTRKGAGRPAKGVE